MPITKTDLDVVALTQEEYSIIVERLNREPNSVELGMIGSLWSEHCGYKHSKELLRLLPSQSPLLIVSPGTENAGVIDIGQGLAIVMKIESHNHPSAVEPYQGAATGVGGIVRDIFAMGARPIALLNSLRFGLLSDPRNRYLFNGVIGGISGYGNCLGIPDVGGEIYFSPSYNTNPLVNAMCVGLVEKDKIIKSQAGGADNLLMLVGADTGRDGIHGASGLASRSFEEERELRSTVQVGNPFLEKILIEACLEIAQTDHIVGMQDLGAAGLTSASIEAAANSGVGLVIDVSKITRRETGMNPYDVMLSESQERMLIIVKQGHEKFVEAIFEKWDLHPVIIGQTTDDSIARIVDGKDMVAELPVKLLTEPPLYRLNGVKPSWQENLQTFNFDELDLWDGGPKSGFLRLLESPNIASKRLVYQQYDYQVQTNTVIQPGADAALIRIKGTNKGIALSTDGNGRYCYLDPYIGGAIAVAEACRNVVCTGASPVAMTDCLNFGNPEKLDVYFQLEMAIKGITKACNALNVPVISGNVSLYNESDGEPIYPTPILGALGMLQDVSRHCTIHFKDEGDVVVLIGANSIDQDATALSGSEYLELIHGIVAGKPNIDLELEKRVQNLCVAMIQKELCKSAHDCSDGGLLISLAESCILGKIGFKGKIDVKGRWDSALFGEVQSRIVVSVDPNNLNNVKRLAKEMNVPIIELGIVSGDSVMLDGVLDVPLTEVSKAWEGGLASHLQ